MRRAMSFGGRALVFSFVFCGCVDIAWGLAGEASWGNAWSDDTGVLSSTFNSLSVFYVCSAGSTTHSSLSACQAACETGDCQVQAWEVQVTPVKASADGMSYEAWVTPGLKLDHMMNLTVKGATPGVMIRVLEDPGLPVGMSAEDMGNGQFRLVWWPREGQVGYVHQVALSSSFSANSSKPLYLNIPVLAPVQSFYAPMHDMMGDEGVVVTVGDTKSIDLMCRANYGTIISMVPGTTLMPGITVHDMSTGDTWTGEEVQPRAAAQRISFTPSRGSEGTETTLCFDCCLEKPGVTDCSMSMQAPTRRCITFQSSLCEYRTGAGDSLLSLSKSLHFSGNWRRLWNMNSDLVPDPEVLISGGTVIKLGPVHVMRPGDSLALVAGRYDTTIKNLLELNPHVRGVTGDGADIKAGTRVCIPACTRKPTPSNDYRLPA